MDELQQLVLQEIIKCKGTAEKITIMKKYKYLLKNMQIVLFDEGTPNFAGFEDRSFGKYHLRNIGDYDRLFRRTMESFYKYLNADGFSKKLALENAVRNTTWDIFHARLIEQGMDYMMKTHSWLFFHILQRMIVE